MELVIRRKDAIVSKVPLKNEATRGIYGGGCGNNRHNCLDRPIKHSPDVVVVEVFKHEIIRMKQAQDHLK